MASIEVLHAYRHLYRQGLHAVQFSKPARYVLRDRLREGFRAKNARFEPDSIARTIQFFEAATRTRGLEHKVLKNLLHVTGIRYRPVTQRKQVVLSKIRSKKPPNSTVATTTFMHYDMTVAMLNKTMGLCLQ